MRDGIDEYTLLCEKCGYVVEGLPREGACPECGRAIAESLSERRNRVPTAWEVLRHPLRSLDRMPIEDESKTTLRTFGRCMIAASVGVMSVPASMALSTAFAFDPVERIINTVISLLVAIVLVILLGPCLVILTEVEAIGLRFLGRRRGARMTHELSRTICSHGCVGWVVAGVSFAAGLCLFTLAMLIDESGLFDPMDRHLLERVIRFGGIGISMLGLAVGFLFFEFIAWQGLRRCGSANRARPAGDGENASGAKRG